MANAPVKRRTTARRPTAEEAFYATNSGDETITENVTGSDGSGTTFTHTGPKLIVMYRPVSWGWESVAVPSSNFSMLLKAGLSINCGDCGGNCSPDPMAPTPNACPSREKFATRRCPVCRKTVYDFGSRVIEGHLQIINPAMNDESDDGTEIDDNAYKLSTPAARTRADLDQHIMAYHPADAASLGLTTPDPRLANPARVPAEIKRTS